MASFWGLIVALLALNAGFSEACTCTPTPQPTPTTTTTTTTTTAPSPTATATVTTTVTATATATAAATTTATVTATTAAATTTTVTATVTATTTAAATTTATVTATTTAAATTTATVTATTTAAATTATVTATTTAAATATTTAAATTQISATPSTSVVPASSTASPTSPPSGFVTYLDTRFKASTCPSAKDASLNSTFRGYFADAMYDLQATAYDVTRSTCQFNFNFTFGPNLQRYNISEVFKDELKTASYVVDGMTLSSIETEVRVDGVSLGEFKATADDCQRICCGAGGQITVTRTCSPSDKCRSYTLQKTEPDCTKVCSDKCSGVTMYKISCLVLLFCAFINWFLE